MKHIFTMKHLYMTTTRRLLACVAILLLSMLNATTANAEDKYFGSGEVLYFKAHPSSWSDFGDVEYHYFAYFFRGGGDAWSSEAVSVEGLPELMQVYAPEGTWSHVILVRKTDANPNWDGDKVQTGDIELSSSSNYLHNFKQNSTDKEWRFLRAIRVFGGTETFYINKTPSSWSGFSSGLGSSWHAFLYFFNDATGASAWSNEVSDNGDGNWWVTVPAGTWTHVIIVRKNNATADWSGTIQQTGNIAFYDCYNYLFDFKQSSSDDWWLTQKTFSSSDKLYIKKHPNEWSSFGDGLGSSNHVFAYFFHKNSGAGGWSNEATEYEPGFLEVTPPTGTWTHVILTRQNSTPADWGHVITTGGNADQSLDITLEEYSNYLHNFCKKVDGETPGVEWWKWIKMGGMTPTTSTEAFYNGAIKREQLDVCADAYTNLDPLSLTPTLQADKKDYNFVDPHVWFKWDGAHWVPMRQEWGNIWVPLSPSDPDDMFFFLWSNYNPNTSRFLHVHRKDCPIDCEITSFKYVLTPVNVSDSTFAIEGIVAFTKQAGDLVISYGDSSVRFSSPEKTPISPQIFSLKGLKADNVTRTLRAQFTGVGGWTADSLVTAPGPNEGIVSHKYDDPDAETHYSVCAESFIHGSTITLTPHVTTTEVDSFAWTDSSGRLLKNGKTGDCTYQINKPGNIYMHELGADTTLVLYYTEYNLPPADEGNLMNNGDYETLPFNYDPTSAYEYTKDYGPGPEKSATPTNIIWDGEGVNKDVYDYATLCGENARVGKDTCYYFGRSSLFGVATNANYFWNRFAHIESREKVMGAAGTHYMAVFDGDSEEQVAWQATTVPSNPKLKLQQGSTYMFSFWVANVNNFGEMISQGNTNNAILQFKIHYKDKKTAAEYEQFLGDSINLNDAKYLNNFWHQNSATFTSPVDADEVTISVVDKNKKGLRIGNDFALDDIRFRAVSIQSSTIRARERFEIKLLEPNPEVKDVTLEVLTQPACDQDSFAFRVNFKYKTNTIHTVDLKMNMEGFESDVVKVTTLPNTADAWKDTAFIFSQIAWTGVSNNVVDANVKARSTDEKMRAQVIVSTTDDRDVYRGDTAYSTLVNLPVIPTMSVGTVLTEDPDCNATEFYLTAPVTYTNQHGKMWAWLDSDVAHKVEITATDNIKGGSLGYLADQRTSRTTTVRLKADVTETSHVLHVQCDGTGSCAVTSASFSEPLVPTMIVTYETEHICGQDVVNMIVHVKYKNIDTDKGFVQVGDKKLSIEGILPNRTTFDTRDVNFSPFKADSLKHTIHAEFTGGTSGCEFTDDEFRAPFSPVVDKINVVTSALACKANKYSATVNVTTINHRNAELSVQLGGVTKTQVVTADVTTFVFDGLTADGLSIEGNAWFKYIQEYFPTCSKTDFSFTAPPSPVVNVKDVEYGDVTCNKLYTTVTFDLEYTNQPAGDLEMWVDDDKAADHMIKFSSPTGFTPNSSLLTLTDQTISHVRADSLDSHVLHVKFSGSGGCTLDFPLPRVPFSPIINSVIVTGNDAKVCGDADTYTATVAVNTTNGRKAYICVSLNDGTPVKKNATGSSTVFEFSGLPANGSTNTVKAWFECMEAIDATCKTTETFTAPTLPQASLVTPITMPDDVAACDQPTFDLTFDLKYTYQDGELQVWVDDDKKGYTTFAASAIDGEGKYLQLNKSEQTKTITLTGLPSDGGTSHYIYYRFNKSGFCGYGTPIKSPALTFPRSPTITGVTVSGVPDKVADCTVETYIATVTVEYKYTADEKIIISYTDKDGAPQTFGPVTLSVSPQEIPIRVWDEEKSAWKGILNDIGKGSKTLEVYFQKSPVDFSECHHPGTYTAPSNSSINSGYDVTVTNASACGERKYNLSGTVTYVGEATGNLHVQFKVGETVIKDSVIAKANCSSSGTAFTMTGLTTDVTGHSLIAYFEDQPKCTAASNPFDAPDICGFDAPIANMSFSTVDCGVTTTTLTFNLNYTYQNGDKLQVWVDNGAKKDVTFEANENNEKTIANIEISGVLADGNTHTLHVLFVNGRCPEKTFTTPEAPFNPVPSVSATVENQCDYATKTTVSYTTTDATTYKYRILGYALSAAKPASASGTFDLDISGLDAGDYTLRIVANSEHCKSDSVDASFTVYPKPTVSASVESQCDYATKTTVSYTTTDATTYKYRILGYALSAAKPASASGTFDLDISGLDAGDYTLRIVANSEHCKSDSADASFTVYPKPTVSASVESQCDYATMTTVSYTTTDASTYNYYIVGKTNLLETAPTALATGSFDLDISSLDAGEYTLKMVANSADCVSDTVSKEFTIFPQPEISATVDDQCDYATSTTVTFKATNATTYNYYVPGKTQLLPAAQAVPANGEGTFELDISTYDAKGYNLKIVANSANCKSDTFVVPFTIHPKPVVTIKSITGKCDNETEATVFYTTSDASTYNYYIVGKTQLLETAPTALATGSFTLDISSLDAGEYTLKMVANSPGCASDTAVSDKFAVYPLPTFTFDDTKAEDCHPSTGISVPYTSTNASKYSYTLTLKGESTPAQTVTEQDASASGSIELHTSGLPAGEYTLEVQAVSGHDCNLQTPATKIVTIHPKPTVTINSVGSTCFTEQNELITVSYSSTDATHYTYKMVDTELEGGDDAVADGSFTINIGGLAPKTYTLQMTVTSANCTSQTIAENFTIYPIPTVTITTPSPIKEKTESVTVPLSFSADVTTYDYSFEYEDGTSIPGAGNSGTGVSVSQTSVTLTTADLDEGKYILKVKPYPENCDGIVHSAIVKVNNLPTIVFDIDQQIVVCEQTETIDANYEVSEDADRLYYSILKDNVPVVAEQEVANPKSSQSLNVNVENLEYGTYTIKARVKSDLGVMGEYDEKTFTVLAHPVIATVSTPDEFIGCDEKYSVTVTANIFNAAGKRIFAKYIDGNATHTPSILTAADAQDVTFTLSDLTDTDNGQHEVVVYIEDFDGCYGVAEYTAPKLMKVTEGFEVTPLPKSCGDDKFTLEGTIFANCDQGKIVVEYDDTRKDLVDANSTTGSKFTIPDIPAGGSVTQLKAYFEGKTCGVVNSAAFTEPTKPEAAISYTAPIVAPACDVTTFDLDFTVNYTYQEAGTLTVWVDETHKNTYANGAESEADKYVALAADEKTFPGTITGLPADGSTGHKLYYKFSGSHSCEGSIDLEQFPQTPLITSVKITGVPSLVPGVDGTYNEHKVTVTYEKAIGEYIVLEYFDKDNNPQFATSTTTVTGDGTYVFSGIEFNDVAVDGTRYVYAYFQDSECTRGDSHTDTYQAPINSSITFGDVTVNDHSLCGKLLYDIIGTVSFVGSAEGDLMIELDGKLGTSIPNAQCVADKALDFRILNVSNEKILSEGLPLKAYFANLPSNPTDYTLNADILLPTLSIEHFKVDTTFTCGDKLYTVSFTVQADNQRGEYELYDSIAGGAVRAIENTAVYPKVEFTIARPAKAEEHYVIVRYPTTSCREISESMDVNPYTKPKPLISLTPIDRLCNSERELNLPFAITQGDIDAATLTLTDAKGAKVINGASLTVNDSKDTLSYLLSKQLNAGKYTIAVEASESVTGCVTSDALQMHVAQDSVVYSKWNDVLLVDNSAGLYSGYQWYENDKPVGDNSQVLYRTDGMTNNSYYCLLTLKDGGQIYTCEYVFQHITPSVEEQQPGNSTTANRILVRPNRVVQGGAVIVQQSEPETLHLVLLSATGQRIAEYTQTDSSKPVNMPTVQGVYLLRITSDSGLQTEKIVVY